MISRLFTMIPGLSSSNDNQAVEEAAKVNAARLRNYANKMKTIAVEEEKKADSIIKEQSRLGDEAEAGRHGRDAYERMAPLRYKALKAGQEAILAIRRAAMAEKEAVVAEAEVVRAKGVGTSKRKRTKRKKHKKPKSKKYKSKKPKSKKYRSKRKKIKTRKKF